MSEALSKFNIAGLPAPTAKFSHVTVVEAGQKTVHIGGQTPIDADGKQLVGDFEAQVALVFANVTTILEALGSSWENVVYTRGYLTRQDDFPVYVSARERFYPTVCKTPPATTSLIVTGLYHADCLFEMDLLAVVPA